MTQKSSANLSVYQQAVLTHLGITPLMPNDRSSESETSQDVPSEAVAVSPIDMARKAIGAAAQNVNRAEASKAVTSLPDHILICIDRKVFPKKLWQDISQACAVSENLVRFVSESEVDNYKDYLFSWHMSGEIQFSAQQLFSPSPNQWQGQDKKTIWRLLTEHILA